MTGRLSLGDSVWVIYFLNLSMLFNTDCCHRKHIGIMKLFQTIYIKLDIRLKNTFLSQFKQSENSEFLFSPTKG